MEDIAILAFDAIKRNITKHGVIAATQSPGKDHKDYWHIWPRDSIFVALEIANFDRIFAEKIVESIINLPHDNGMFYQRYEQDSIPDPHGWCNDDDSRQLDQDALKFVALARLPNIKFNRKDIKNSYKELLSRIENRCPSTDVWEQKRGYFFYTTATLIWGLRSAEKILPKSAARHSRILRELVNSLEAFYDEKMQSYVKSPSERIMDLELALGINILFESGAKVFDSHKKLMRVISTLESVERELCHSISNVKIPIRYKGDVWNGETWGPSIVCRPWPMGCAIISQSYCHAAKAALEMNCYDLFLKSLKNAERWLNYARSVPNIESFPEQIDYDGSMPEFVPRALSWCAAEIIKAERMFQESRRKVRQRSRYYLN
jgi:GH15 family glucan-1,4-alpha-glucosidase